MVLGQKRNRASSGRGLSRVVNKIQEQFAKEIFVHFQQFHVVFDIQKKPSLPYLFLCRVIYHVEQFGYLLLLWFNITGALQYQKLHELVGKPLHPCAIRIDLQERRFPFFLIHFRHKQGFGVAFNGSHGGFQLMGQGGHE